MGQGCNEFFQDEPLFPLVVLRHALVDGLVVIFWGFDGEGDQLVRLREGKSHVL